MLDKVVSLLSLIMARPAPKKRDEVVGRHRPAYQHQQQHAMFIRRVIDSSKMEGQIATSIEWVHRLYRKGFLLTETYHELIHHAIYREEQIITERVKKDFICPHVKRRADEIIEEERRRNIRIVKTEVN